MERQLKVGDKIKLLLNRGNSNAGDVLTVGFFVENNALFRTVEDWMPGETHALYTKHPNHEWEYVKEENYELY